MAYAKKSPSAAYEKLERDLKAGTLGGVYIFHGEESFLREEALRKLKQILVPAGFEAFNFHRLDGRNLTIQDLAGAAEALPMMAERTLIMVSDLELFRLDGEQREALTAFLADVPAHCCVVFDCDTAAYQPDKKQKNLCAAISKYAEVVEFKPLDGRKLAAWIQARFQERGKTVDLHTAEYLIFLCGGLMTGLLQEIDKIAVYAEGPSVTQQDIDAVAAPVLSAEVFKMTDAVTDGNIGQAARILGDLLNMQTEPIRILAALGNQLRRLYTARLAIDNQKDAAWLQKLWGMRSDYPARLLLSAARKTSRRWCGRAVRMCEVLDQRMKSETGLDSAGELKLLLVRLRAGRR